MYIPLDAETALLRIYLQAIFRGVCKDVCINKVTNHGIFYNNKIYKQPRIPIRRAFSNYIIKYLAAIKDRGVEKYLILENVQNVMQNVKKAV